MTEPDKRCGTCRYYEAAEGCEFGACAFPIPVLPDSMREIEAGYVFSRQGTTCPCWEAKE